MKLLSLEIIGFKSFAKKTVLNFDEGIIVIAGPNGCGKSNIVDALKWVFGETSAQDIRTPKMCDVIFQGSSHEKPLNFAEVTCTFDNSENTLNLPFTTVAISRRIYRNGDNTYFLNRKKVRHKDIQDIFLNTGVGKTAFSIFEQGKADAIIHGNPLSRQALFAQAAEIERLLKARDQAIKKIDKTNDNLSRIEDIFLEVDKQLTVLKKQREEALLYQEREERLKLLEKGLMCTYWTRTQKSAHELEEHFKKELLSYETLNKEKERLSEEQRRKKEHHTQLEKKHQDNKESLFSLKGMLQGLDLEVKAFESALIKAEELAEKLNSQKETYRTEIDALKESFTMSQNILCETEELFQKNQQLYEEQKEKKIFWEKQIQEKENTLNALYQEEKEIKSKLFEIQRDKEKCELKTEFIKTTQEKMHDSLEEKKRSLNDLIGSIEELKKEHDDLQHALNVKEQLFKECKEETEEVKEALQEKTNDYLLAQKTYTATDAQLKSLEKLANSFAGYKQGTKKLLTASQEEGHPLFNCLTPLSKYFFPKKGYEKKLATFLFHYKETCVVNSLEEQEKVIRYAKEENIFGFSLFCLEHLKNKDSFHNDHIEVKEGFLALAHHFLQNFSEEYTFNLLQEGLFEDQRHVLYFLNEEEQNPFYRTAQEKELKQTREEVQNHLDSLETQLSDLKLKLKEHTAKDAALLQEIQALTYEMQHKKNTLLQKEKELSAVKANITTLEEKIEQESLLLKKSQEYLALKETELQQTADLCADKTSVIELHKEKINESKEAILSFFSEFQQLEENALNVEKQLNKEKHKQDLFSLQQKEKQKQLETIEQDIKSSIENREELLKKLHFSKENITKHIEKLSHSEHLFKESEEILQESQEALLESDHMAKSLEKMIVDHEKEQISLQLKIDEKKHEIERLDKEFQEIFQLSIASEKENIPPLEHSIDETQKEMRRLRRTLEERGDLHLGAIDAYKKCEERRQFIQEQMEDLVAAKEKLDAIIKDLQNQSLSIYQKTFEAIRLKFQENFATLFNGGRADLLFVNPEDILQSGIHILAEPPGKKLRSIQQLSGGEKTLTALALLFAIFSVKHAPFCLLDEIDAPLDETNVIRFLKLLKSFTKNTQFIAITHNRLTMQAADKILGVTMEQPGISKILTLSLEEVQTDNRLSLETQT